jgi:hypothetical protein
MAAQAANIHGQQAKATAPAHLAHRTAKIVIPASTARTLSQLKIRRAGSAGPAVPLAATPDCPTGWWNHLAGTVTWWYDSNTRITVSSSTNWSASVSCQNMAFENIGSTLFFRGSKVADGFNGICGTQSSTGPDCGYLTEPTYGTWNCTGVGSCDGGYQESMSMWIQLPAGYEWVPATVPTPQCFLPSGGGNTMICGEATNVVTVPYLN